MKLFNKFMEITCTFAYMYSFFGMSISMQCLFSENLEYLYLDLICNRHNHIKLCIGLQPSHISIIMLKMQKCFWQSLHSYSHSFSILSVVRTQRSSVNFSVHVLYSTIASHFLTWAHDLKQSFSLFSQQFFSLFFLVHWVESSCYIFQQHSASVFDF